MPGLFAAFPFLFAQAAPAAGAGRRARSIQHPAVPADPDLCSTSC